MQLNSLYSRNRTILYLYSIFYEYLLSTRTVPLQKQIRKFIKIILLWSSVLKAAPRGLKENKTLFSNNILLKNLFV